MVDIDVDTDAAHRFLVAIAGDGGAVTLQSFDDGPGKRGKLVRTRHGHVGAGDIDTDELAELNNAGAGIFLTINTTNGRARTAADIVAVRALFVDIDRDAPDPTWHIQPNIIVRSGGQGRLHAYWTIEPGMPLDEFGAAQRALAQYYDSDTVSDLPRVMRLPGFWHKKRDPAVLTTCEILSEHRRPFCEVLAGIPAAIVPGPPPVQPRLSVSLESHLDEPDDDLDDGSEHWPSWISEYPLDVRIARAHRVLLNTPPAISGQNGSSATFKAALAVVKGFCIPPDQATAVLLESYNGRCVPPWTENEILKKANDATTAVHPAWGYLLEEGRELARIGKGGLIVGGKRLAAPKPAVAIQRPLEPVVEVLTVAGETGAELCAGIPGLQFKKTGRGVDGALEMNVLNVAAILRHAKAWAGIVRHNDFAQRLELLKPPPFATDKSSYPREMRDDDVTRAVEWFLRVFPGTNWNNERVQEGLVMVGRDNAYHPVRDYLRGLEWDGVERTHKWLQDHAGAADTAYTAAVGRAWLVSAVARVMSPVGCKADNVLILEGSQGTRKSTLLRVLAGDQWFSDTIDTLGSQASREQIQGVWICELAELDAMSKGEVSKTKAFLSQKEDRFRPSYGKFAVSFPRQCVFAGSVNHSDYLRDETGARRFWPVKCLADSELSQLDTPGIALRRDDLWAEAVSLFDSNYNWWLSPEVETLAAKEQAARYSGDVWEAHVARYVTQSGEASVADILSRGLSIEIGKAAPGDAARVQKVIARLGMTRTEHDCGGGRTEWRYRMPA